ncbi:MAG TPA: hypothetical protein RMH99_09895 [Sandaracinaceae bacterium LLY-WYZ-13_1]|nr:hypothetical protein [Sandaracinaceae bacterium LLY-WYZ-13_1]
MSRSGLCQWAFVGWLCALEAAAQAPPGASVAARVEGCEGLSAAEVRRSLRVELRAHLVSPDEIEPGTTRAEARCDRARRARLRVWDPVTGKDVRRTIDLSEIPEPGRARVVALALAELVLASWTEAVTNPRPAVAPLESTAPEPERSRVRELVERRHPQLASVDRVRGGVSATAQLRVMLESPLALGGGELEGRLAWNALELSVAAGVVLASVDRRLGSVLVGLADAAAGIGLVVTTGAFRWRLTARVRVGYGWLRGSADHSGDRGGFLDGLLVGPEAVASVAAPVVWPLVPRLDIRFGYVPSGLVGTVAGEDPVSLRGAWLTIALGLDWDLR